MALLLSLLQGENLGEIDVSFPIGDVRYILEAKWEATPVDETPIIKLDRRVKQSLAGTRGIVLSMSGFTREAIAGTNLGGQLSLVLAEAEHLEAILAGVMAPDELVSGLVDQASFMGKSTASIADLIRQDMHDDVSASVVFGGFDDCPADFVVRGQVTAKHVLVQHDWSQSGIAVRAAGQLIITTGGGLIEVDEQARSASWLLRSRWCSNSAAVLNNGDVAIVRRHGVISVAPDGKIRIIGGGLEGNASLFVGPNQKLWALENGGGERHGQPRPVTITEFGEGIGKGFAFAVPDEVAAPFSMLGVTCGDGNIYLASPTGISEIGLSGSVLTILRHSQRAVNNLQD